MLIRGSIRNVEGGGWPAERGIYPRDRKCSPHPEPLDYFERMKNNNPSVPLHLLVVDVVDHTFDFKDQISTFLKKNSWITPPHPHPNPTFRNQQSAL